MKDFEALLLFNSYNCYNVKLYSEQFKKYYDYTRGINYDDNPFNPNTTEKLIQTIESELGIDREKLNALPK